MMACYYIANGTTRHANAIPCGIYTSAVPQYCCAPGDFCLGNSICHFTHPDTAKSGYYIGSCTDESFSSPACSKECSNLALQDIVFNETTSLWSCCWSSNGVDCSSPSNDSFQAPSPEQLSVSSYTAVPSDSVVPSSAESSLASTTTSLASSMTSQASTMTSPASSSLGSLGDFSSNTSPLIETVFPQPSSAPSTGLTTGAKTGITVTGTVVGLALLAAIFYLLVRQARLRKPDTSDSGATRGGTSYKEAPFGGELGTKRSVELDSSAQVELPACIDTI